MDIFLSEEVNVNETEKLQKMEKYNIFLKWFI